MKSQRVRDKREELVEGDWEGPLQRRPVWPAAASLLSGVPGKNTQVFVDSCYSLVLIRSVTRDWFPSVRPCYG